MAISHLDLYLFDPPRIALDGQAVHVPRRKATALFAYLAVTGLGHSRDALATLLWPEKAYKESNQVLIGDLQALLAFTYQDLGKIENANKYTWEAITTYHTLGDDAQVRVLNEFYSEIT